MNFADRLDASIKKSKSFLLAGFDPTIESLPKIFLLEGAQASTSEEAVYRVLTKFYDAALDALDGIVSSVKPNIAFFEQYGLGGLRALMHLCEATRERKIPLIMDAKRGDIGSTAAAYSRAFLGSCTLFGKPIQTFNADAVTVNPYLGFDTLDPFIKDCLEYDKGIFILVKTSNPGSHTIQGVKDRTGEDISSKVASWIHEHSAQFKGASGYSGLGAVVGAPYPEEAMRLRKLMPNNYLLIPGFGAQGGNAKDAVAGFAGSTKKKTTQKRGGAIINASRGLMSNFKDEPLTLGDFKESLRATARRMNKDIAAVL